MLDDLIAVAVQQNPQAIHIAGPTLNHDQNSVTSVAQTFSMANALAQGQATLVQGDNSAAGSTLWMPANHVVVQGNVVCVLLSAIQLILSANLLGCASLLVKITLCVTRVCA